MTMSTQTSVMAALRARVEGPEGAPTGLVLVDDPEWANTGSVHARRHDELDALGATLDYRFSDAHINFRLLPNHEDAVGWSRHATITSSAPAWLKASKGDLVTAVADLIAPLEERERDHLLGLVDADCSDIHDTTGRITVMEMRDLCSAVVERGYGHRPVLLDTGDWYVEVGGIGAPGSEAGWSGLTLFRGDEFDTRSI